MKPLSQRRRSFVLTFLILVFIFSVPLILAYSTGYRLDDTYSLVKTGGVFIYSDIANTQVYVDDEFIEDNGVILRNTLIQDLTPNQSYKLKVEKDGYQSWYKELEVHPNLVTEARILLSPNETQFNEIEPTLVVNSTTTLNATTTAPNLEYLAIDEIFLNDLEQFELVVATTTPGVIETATTTILSLPDYIEKLEIKDIEDKIFLKEKNKIVTWLEDGNIHVVWADGEGNVPYYFCNGECKEKIVIDLISEILYYDFLPGRDDVLLVLVSDGIYAVEIDDRSAPNFHTIYQKPNLDFRVRDNSTIFIKDGEIYLEVI